MSIGRGGIMPTGIVKGLSKVVELLQGSSDVFQVWLDVHTNKWRSFCGS